MKKISLILLGFIILMFIVPHIKAEDTTVDIIVIGEGNVTGYINCTSINGSVSYYIDGREVRGEFDKVWNSISKVRKTAQRARSLAGSAYRYADNNHDDIIELSMISENNTDKIYILHDELVAFENDYIVFKNNTNTTFTQIIYKINSLEGDVANLQEKYNTLEQRFYISCVLLMVCFVLLLWVIYKQNKMKKRD